MPQSPFTVLTMRPGRQRGILPVPAVVSEIVFQTILTQTCPLLLFLLFLCLLLPPAMFPCSRSRGHSGLIAWWNFHSAGCPWQKRDCAPMWLWRPCAWTRSWALINEEQAKSENKKVVHYVAGSSSLLSHICGRWRLTVNTDAAL